MFRLAERKIENAVAFDLHVHTRCPRKSAYKSLSDGISTPKEIASFAKKIGLKGIAVTDHNTVDGVAAIMEEGKSKGLMIVPGCELTAFDRTEILAYGVDNIRGLTGSTIEIIEAVHERGGVAVKAHPIFSAFKDLKNPFSYAEVFNALEVNSVTPLFLNEYLTKESLKRGLNLIGGSDSHSYRTIGNAVTLFHDNICKLDDAIGAISKGRIKAKQFSSDYSLRFQVYPQHLKLFLNKPFYKS